VSAVYGPLFIEDWAFHDSRRNNMTSIWVKGPFLGKGIHTGSAVNDFQITAGTR